MDTVPSEYRNAVYHFRGPSTYNSPYTLTDQALKNYGVSRELFGSTTVIITQEVQFNVKDYQYVITKDANGNPTEVGMYFLPVSDNSSVPDSNGNMVSCGQVVDDFIRQKSGLGPNDDIYALISYMHPEISQGTIAQLSKTEKSQLGFTHMGAYLGNGVTSNSPVAYHDHRFGCAWGGVIGTNYGYPCNVHIVSLKGVNQNVLNRNCQLVDLLVGHGLEFPGDYQNSIFRPEFINAALMYYRDWLMQEDYLMNNTTWYFYCAANKLTILNIAFNLPHNRKSFQEVYGETEGSNLWDQFLLRYTNATGFDFYYYPGLETDFVPLWKQEGLEPSDIIPFTIEQYREYDKHRRQGTSYDGPMPVMPPKAVICSAQSTADIVYEFIQIYADPYDAGPLSTVAVLWGFMPVVLARTGISEREYLKYTLSIFQLLIYSDARVNAAIAPAESWLKSQWFWDTYQMLITIFGGTATTIASVSDQQHAATVEALIAQDLQIDSVVARTAGNQPPNPPMLAVFSLLNVILQWDTIMKGGVISAADAYVEFMKAAQAPFYKADKLVVKKPKKIQYNILPAAFNLISNDLYSKNDLVNIETICTAVDVSEIQLKES
jgi:hypothetical protein